MWATELVRVVDDFVTEGDEREHDRRIAGGVTEVAVLKLGANEGTALGIVELVAQRRCQDGVSVLQIASVGRCA